MTAINLPGQLEVMLVVDHKIELKDCTFTDPRDVQIAKLLRQYEERPTSEIWGRIQKLAAEILK